MIPRLATALALLTLAASPVVAAPSDLDDDGLCALAQGSSREAARLFKKLARLYPDHGKARKNEKRARVFDRWVRYRDEALAVIFDKTIYPDENHGEAGQETVDEHVERARAAWRPLEALLRRDLKKLLKLQPQQARQQLSKARRLRQTLGELEAILQERGLEPVDPVELAPVVEALLTHRAGEIDATQDFAERLSGYEQQLLARLSDARVQAHNASFLRTNPHDYGKQPSSAEVEQVRITNDYRIVFGRPALELDPRLIESAHDHSADMTRLDFFAHESPVDGKQSASDRMSRADYPAPGGENIYLGGTAPQAAHNGWYHSSGHHRNILHPGWKAMGSGQDGKHWTQNFGYEGTLER